MSDELLDNVCKSLEVDFKIVALQVTQPLTRNCMKIHSDATKKYPFQFINKSVNAAANKISENQI